MNYDPNLVMSVEDSASEYIDKVNNLLAQYGVVDKDGNPAQLAKLAGSPLWLLALADGQNITEWQERLRNAYNAIDVANCADSQVENLAILAGIIKREGSAPYIILRVTNTTGNPITINSTNCIATDELTQNEWYSGQSYELIVDETADLVFYCRQRSVEVPKEISFTLHDVESSWPDFSAVSVSASRVLEAPETLAQLRNRIIMRKARYDIISQAETAISGLDGISKCSIWFNKNQIAPITLPGGKILPARTAYICIQGYDAENLIARTFFSYSIVSTLQTEESLSSQVLIGADYHTVYYDQCKSQMVYIKIKVKPVLGDMTYTKRIKDTLLPYSGTLKVGENITAQMVCEWLGQLDAYCTIYTAYVGTSAEPSGDVTNISVNSLLQFTEDNITFELVN